MSTNFSHFYILLGVYVEAEVDLNIKNENTGHISFLTTVMREVILAEKGLGSFWNIHHNTGTNYTRNEKNYVGIVQ
jgi:hypothetical protein